MYTLRVLYIRRLYTGYSYKLLIRRKVSLFGYSEKPLFWLLQSRPYRYLTLLKESPFVTTYITNIH